MATRTASKQAAGKPASRTAGATGKSQTAPESSGAEDRQLANALTTAMTDAGTDFKAGPAIEALKQDHRRVEKLFSSYESSDDAHKDELVKQICSELIIHTKLEEEIFYPACRRAMPDEEMLNEAQVEHDSTKILIADLLEGDSDDPYRDAKVSVLAEQIKHHVGEEEKPKEGVFAQAAARGVDSDDLAKRLRERKAALQGRAARLRPTRVISFHPTTDLEDDMPRYSDNDRDERGRFISDDDRGRRFGARRGGSSRYEDYDDDRGHGRGGWFGDSESHSRAARSRFDDDDDRRYGSRSRSRYDDDDDGRGHGRGGWFGDSEGHSRVARSRFDDDDDDRRGSRSRSRYDDDDDGRGHGRGGWFGDSEGHSRAARSRFDDDDDRRGGLRSRSRYDDDDDGRGHGRGGWFGDSEGHSRAARSRFDDDDRRGGSRSRSRDDDDDDGRGHGRGGWFGDSRGHAQASRRGWDNRR